MSLAGDGGFDEVATLEAATTEAEVQPNDSGSDDGEFSPITQDELRELIKEVATAEIRPLLDRNYKGMESQVARIRNEFAGAVQAIAELKEEVGNTREVKALVEMLAEDRFTPEEIAAKADKLREAAEQKAKDRELAQLRAQQRAQQEAAQRAAQQPDPDAYVAAVNQEITDWWEERGERDVRKLAERAGVAEDVWKRLVPQQMPMTSRGRPDYVGFMEQMESALDEAAKESEQAARRNRPRATPDTTRPAGSAAGLNQDLVNRLAWGESLSPADFAKATELYNNGNGLLPQRRPRR